MNNQFKILHDGVSKMELFCNTEFKTPIINLVLRMSSGVLTVLQIMAEKSKECYVNNVLSMHREIKTVL